MQLKHCLEGKCIPLISYIENKALKSVRYKLLSTENQKKSILNPNQARGNNKITMETIKKKTHQENQ